MPSFRDIRGLIILTALVGSRAYGTAREDSDEDWRGVYAAPPRDLWRIAPKPPQTIDRRNPDEVIYELERFCALAAKANPNVLEILWAGHHTITPEGELLVGNRDIFLSRRALLTYGGYAKQQLRKAQEGTGGSRGTTHFKREKFILHLFRLMEAGTHLLRTGELEIRVEDPDALREKARMPLHEVEVEFEGLDAEMKEAAASSPLPERVDYGAINGLVIRIRESMMEWNWAEEPAKIRSVDNATVEEVKT